jgi:c(7)-type cytochrome triheme protein
MFRFSALWRLVSVGIAGLGLWLTTCAQPLLPEKTPLELALETAVSRQGPAKPTGQAGGPGPPAAGAGQSEGVSEEAVDSLAQILIEAEKEQHPLAFYFLPKSEQGSYVDWVAALKYGIIRPVDALDPNKKTMPPIDFNVVFKVKGDLPDVVYPHYPHTVWLDCKNCHPSIFVMRAGVNQVTMNGIMRGEFCGRCHGKVAFPLYDCNRCHSRPKPGKDLIIPKAKK